MASQERVTRPTERRFYGAGEALGHPNLNLLGWFLTGQELQIMVFVLLPIGCLFVLSMFLPNHLKIPRRQIYIWKCLNMQINSITCRNTVLWPAAMVVALNDTNSSLQTCKFASLDCLLRLCSLNMCVIDGIMFCQFPTGFFKKTPAFILSSCIDLPLNQNVQLRLQIGSSDLLKLLNMISYFPADPLIRESSIDMCYFKRFS